MQHRRRQDGSEFGRCVHSLRTLCQLKFALKTLFSTAELEAPSFAQRVQAGVQMGKAMVGMACSQLKMMVSRFDNNVLASAAMEADLEMHSRAYAGRGAPFPKDTSSTSDSPVRPSTKRMRIQNVLYVVGTHDGNAIVACVRACVPRHVYVPIIWRVYIVCMISSAGSPKITSS